MPDQPNKAAHQSPKQFLTIAEVAALYAIGESTIYRNIRLKRFPKPLKICGQNRWHIDQLPNPEEGDTA